MDPFSLALLGGSALSGIMGASMNTRSAQAINQQNIQAQQQANYQAGTGALLPQYFKNLAAGANAAGISPLAALGVSAPSVSTTIPASPTNPGSGMDALSQNLSRAAGVFSTANTKAAALDLQSKALDLAGKREDVIAKQWANTRRAVGVSPPGTPPPFPPFGDPASDGALAGTHDNPYPMTAWYRDPETGDIFKGLSRQFAGTQFGPSAYYSAMRAMPSLVGSWLNDFNDYAHSQALQMRGDIWRDLNNPPPIVDPYSNYGGG